MEKVTSFRETRNEPAFLGAVNSSWKALEGGQVDGRLRGYWPTEVTGWKPDCTVRCMRKWLKRDKIVNFIRLLNKLKKCGWKGGERLDSG